MHLFRRSESSSSSKSRTSTIDSTSDFATPRTSTESNALNKTLVQLGASSGPQSAPVLSLPIELIQHITSYLDTASAASLCLSSRYICYALGSDRLSTYIEASKSRFEKRKTIEAVVERAFPHHWFCAWCDKFHSWTPSDGPTTFSNEKSRDCAEFNSYLHEENDYVLCYHHVRLAMNRVWWGPEHGIPLTAFDYTKASMTKILKTPVPTKLDISAKIVNDHFLVHTTFAIILPSFLTTKKNLLSHLWPHLPHILSGHRDSENGHTGLMAAIDNTVRRNWQYLFTQMCSSCTSDWTVACHHFPHSTGGQARLLIQTWRDLGSGRNPFDTAWRAHGVCTKGVERCTRWDGVGVKGMQAGDIRRAFESVGEEIAPSSVSRTMSPSRARIYKAFMRRSTDEDAGTEVRRSRARPRAWRTRSENEEVFRLEEEERIELARQVAERLVRMDAERGRCG